jgi:hypothetical protein
MRNFVLAVSLSFFIGCGGDNNTIATDKNTNLTGVFFNTNVKLGGQWTSNLNIKNNRVNGYFNATQFSTATTMMCGAGDFDTSINNGHISGDFFSNDNDDGCTFDKRGILKFQSQIDNNLQHMIGNYSTQNNEGSSFIEGGKGFFEIWDNNMKPSLKSYHGTFTNTTVSENGSVDIKIAEGEKLIFGNIDFNELAGNRKLCGAGEFSGIIDNDNITFAFESNDLDEGCSFDKGTHFEIKAKYSDSKTKIIGDYYLDNIKSGNFSVNLQ